MSPKDIVLVTLYVDENSLIGNLDAIETVELFQKNRLVLKVVVVLQDYLSHGIGFSDNNKKSWLGQPYLIKSLRTKFGELVL